VIFASSNHAVGFYPRHHRIGPDVTARPDGRYGVSKVFGEALASLYADKYGMKNTSLRIGNFGDQPLDQRRLSIWLHPDDMVQLCRIGLEHPEIHYEVLYGAPTSSAIAPLVAPKIIGNTPWPNKPRRRPIRSLTSIKAARSARWSSRATPAASGVELNREQSARFTFHDMTPSTPCTWVHDERLAIVKFV
jgi:hypothetical protein